MISTLLIRHARPTDWPQISSLLGGVHSAGMGGMRNILDFLVAQERGYFAGCAAVEKLQDSALITTVCVPLDCQGHGIGTALLERAVQDTCAAGAKWIFVDGARCPEFFARSGFSAERVDLLPDILVPRMTLNAKKEIRLMSRACT